MTANLQSRSASMSNPMDNEPVTLLKASASKNSGALRSASIGSSFFNKDTSNFFNQSADVANTSTHSMDDELVQESSGSSSNDGTSGNINVSTSATNNGPSSNNQDRTIAPGTASADLDIVGALGNLDLDGDFELPKDPSNDGAAINEHQNDNQFPQQPHFFYAHGADASAGNYYQQFYHPPHQGSLTPNPSGAGFMPSTFGPTSTPSTTWANNFVPSSAPPFAYGNGSNPNDLNLNAVKPFELPEDSKDGASSSEQSSINGGASSSNANTSNGSGPIPNGAIPPNIPNLHVPFSTPPPPVFGGVLDSQMQFNPGQPAVYSGSGYDGNKGIKQEGNVSNDSSVNPSGTPIGQPFPVRNFPISGTPNPVSLAIGGEASKNSYFNDNLSMPMPPPMIMGPPPQVGSPSMWNQHPIINTHHRHPSIPGQPGFDTRLGGSGIQPVGGQFNGGMMPNRFNGGGNSHHGGRHRHNHNNYGMNNGMNVHRKMHNNHRRKGDDASKYANAKLEDFTGEFFSLCKDQHGCRFLQRQLDLGREAAATNDPNLLTNDIAATMIFNEIYLKIIELMVDPFGNYLIQKLFENVSNDQRIILVKNAAPEFIRIALDPHGTRALQKLVECISTEEEAQLIIKSLSPHIVSLSRDLNGNHVVQKCLQKLKSEDNQFIFETASLHCNEIATHRHGCCVLQRCLDHGNAEQRQQLSLKVAENATNLSLDPFGNYVVQYVLSRGDDESIRIILDHIKSNVISLSLHKFGSNVIEKSLRINKLTDSLIKVLLLNKDRFSEMLNDAFGNYVLQTSLDVASKEDLADLSLALQPLLPNIKNTPHGRRIMTKIQSIL